MKAYAFKENLFSLNENDIEAVDWPNQSFKIKKSKRDSLRNSKKALSALSASYFVLIYNSKVIDTIGFIEFEQAWSHIVPKIPMVCHFKNGVFSNDGWFVIVPYESSHGTHFKQLFNKQVYDKFKQMNLLNTFNWQQCDSNVQVPNAPNKSFFKDFGAKFQDEVYLVFGDSLQDEIDTIANSY